jgi:hypothetical protein
MNFVFVIYHVKIFLNFPFFTVPTRTQSGPPRYAVLENWAQLPISSSPVLVDHSVGFIIPLFMLEKYSKSSGKFDCPPFSCVSPH